MYIFTDRVSCISGWSQSFHVAEDELELLTQPPPPEYWGLVVRHHAGFKESNLKSFIYIYIFAMWLRLSWNL